MKMKCRKNRSQKFDKIDLDITIETNIENIACLGKKMPLCNKQQLSNI